MLASSLLAAAMAAPAPANASPAPHVLERVPPAACPDTARHCFGLDVHVVRIGDEPVATPSWIDAQISEANRHFAAIDVGFEIASVTAAPASYAHVATREQRDAIGREPSHREHTGTIPVFVVSRLEDVDAPGQQIRGVHWRRRQNIEQRWLIVSTIAKPMVLAHELGHYFGLAHSGYAVSIMNKRDRKEPPASERTFAPPEIDELRRGRDAALAKRQLVSRR